VSTGPRFVARTGRRKEPELGQSRPGDWAPCSRRAPELARPLSRPVDRATYEGQHKVRDVVRSSNPSRNRYFHSAIRARTLRVGVVPVRRPEEPPVAPRDKVTTAPPPAELVPHYTEESRLWAPGR
jgi:hypothetical protein